MISRLIQKIKIWFALRSVIKGTISDMDFHRIPQFLEQHPGKKENIIANAREHIEYGSPWPGLLLCLGLIRADVPETIELIRLLKLNAPTYKNRESALYWERFREDVDTDAAHELVLFSWKYGEDIELQQVLQQLSERQVEENLVKCVQLLKAPHADILRLVNTVLRDRPATWDKIDIETVKIYVSFICQNGEAPDIEALFQKLSLYQLLTALTILDEFPTPHCLSALKRIWWEMEEKILIDFNEMGEGVGDVGLITVADAAAVALGRCAAHDTKYKQIHENHQGHRTLDKTIEEYSMKVKEFNTYAEKYRAKSQSKPNARNKGIITGISEKMIRLRTEITELEKKIKTLEKKYKENLCPAYILLRVLKNAQRYPIAVQQGAAYGLYILLFQGHLIASTRLEIFKLLYLFLSDKSDSHFPERIIRLLPESGISQLTTSLRSGIEWMVDIMELFATECKRLDCTDENSIRMTHLEQLEQTLREERSRYLSRFAELQTTVKYLVDIMPWTLRFLNLYPLRLMQLNHHKKILGEYLKVGCTVQLWTKYSPPKDVGEVHRRYLQLENRTKPNSMGIVYTLFQHPFLSLPVIYHEYLHYGGPKGEPAEGIENETEVHLREIIFARGLISRLSPKDDNQISGFERSIIEQIRAIGMDSLFFQLMADIHNDQVLGLICHEIINTYGPKLSIDNAEGLALGQIEKDNININMQNDIQTWDRNVTWPCIGDSGTEFLKKNYLDALIKRKIIDHAFDPRQRDRLMQDHACTSSLKDWNTYCGRTGALDVFNQYMQSRSINSEIVIRLIVRRFDITVEETNSILDFLVHTFGGIGIHPGLDHQG